MTDILMLPVVGSSNIAEVGYDPKTQEFRVRFHSGLLYAHYGVNAELYSDFRSGKSSLGKFYNEFIKNKYAYRKLETTKPVPIEEAARLLAAELGPFLGDGGIEIVDSAERPLQIHVDNLLEASSLYHLTEKGYLGYGVMIVAGAEP